MIQDLTFLESGAYTPRDATVLTIAKSLRKLQVSSRKAVSEYLSRELHLDESQKDTLFRRRTASQILDSGFATGCSDYALAFTALARALDIPTKWVDTFEASWIADPRAQSIRGHVFVDVLAGNTWSAYEPLRGFTPGGSYSLNGRAYIEVGKGLDFSAVYLKEEGMYRSTPTNLQRFDEALRRS